ncbi:MAG: cobaltochelatase subunit CobN, partial [Euryarchaeota archaeon]
MVLAVVALIPAFCEPVSAVHVVLFTNAPLAGVGEAAREVGVSASVYPVPKQPEDVSKVPWEVVRRELSRSDVVVIDAMGGVPRVLVERLSGRSGASVPDLQSFARLISRRVPIVLVVHSKLERSVAVIRGGRLAGVVGRPGVIDAVVAHVWLCLHSGDARALLSFLAWLADPGYPTERVVPPRHLGAVALSTYVPGRGYRSLGLRVSEEGFRRWLARLERGGPGLIVYEPRVARDLPGWVAEALGEAVTRLDDVLRGLPGDLVVVLAHGAYLMTPVRSVVEAVVNRLDAVARRYGARAVGVYCGLGLVTPAMVLERLRELGKRVEVVVSLRAFTLNFPRPAEYVLSRLNAPMVQVVFPFLGDERMSVGEYVGERAGPLLEWTYQVQLGSEREGAFWFRVLWLNSPEGPRLLPGTLDDLAGLVGRLLRLRRLPNREKRVALVVYCYPPGRSGLGAAYLDVPRSLVRLLAALAGWGFDLGPATGFFARL